LLCFSTLAQETSENYIQNIYIKNRYDWVLTNRVHTLKLT
jgi:hypothetical protein